MIWTSLLLGLSIGAVMGLTGAGGGILAIPALVLGIGLDMVSAKPVALLAATAGAMLGAADGLRRGLVRYKAALFMVLLGAITSPLGQWLAHQVAPELLAILFSGILLFVAVRGWRQSLRAQTAVLVERTTPCMLNPLTGKFSWTPRCFLTLGGMLFALSIIGIFLNRRNLVVLLMAIELMLLSVSMNFVAFAHYLGDLHGQVFVFFILTVAAAEAAIGLAILVLLFRNKTSINAEDLNTLKG